MDRDARQAFELGYTGKAIIHPKHIAVVHQVFRPSEDDLKHARRVVEAFDKARREGRGVTVVDGRMVDLPIVERAWRLLRDR